MYLSIEMPLPDRKKRCYFALHNDCYSVHARSKKIVPIVPLFVNFIILLICIIIKVDLKLCTNSD